MATNKTFKAKIFVLALLPLAALSAAFFSCSDMSQPAGAALLFLPQAQNESVVKIVGSFSAGGVIPEEIAADLYPDTAAQSEGASRTVMPTLSSYGCSFTVEAANTAAGSDEKYTATVRTSARPYTYELAFPASAVVDTGKKFRVTAKAQKSVSGTMKILFVGQSDEFEISTENTITMQDIILKPVQEGAGSVCPYISIDSSISSSKMILHASPDDIEKTSNSTSSAYYSINPVNSGVYKADFYFYSKADFYFYSKADCQGELLYSFTDVINVFDNFESDVWIQNGSSPWLVETTSSGTTTTRCKITKELIENFRLTTIHVDASAEDSEESGTFVNPCKTFEKAFEKIQNQRINYTIVAHGTIAGNLTITDDTIKAKSLAIIGGSSLDENGRPVDALDGGGIGSALCIKTSIPITISNLKITGGAAGEDGGGGIYNEGTLTLKSGVLVTGNSSSANGGGICNVGETAVLVMEGGEISENTADKDGGALFIGLGSSVSISGSAHIPSGSSKRNDVFLAGQYNYNAPVQMSQIKIAGALSAHSESDKVYVTPKFYGDKNGVLALEVGAQTSLSAECGKFELAVPSVPGVSAVPIDSQGAMDFPITYERTQAAPPTKAPEGTGGTGGTGVTYVYFGKTMQSVLPEDSPVTIYKNITDTHGYYTYFYGSDGAWYYYIYENSYKDTYKYTDGSYAKKYSSDTPGWRYFKVEPIKWRVINSNHNGKWLLLAENAIDARRYLDEDRDRTISGATVKSTNYMHSAIRAYLNGYQYKTMYWNKQYSQYFLETITSYDGKGFLQSFFTEEEQEKIYPITVDNSQNPSGYECPSTDDKIFILSKGEVDTYTVSQITRETTDYTIARGGWLNAWTDPDCRNVSYWWTRTTYSSPGYGVYVGRGDSGNFNESHASVTENACCVPALCIDPL